MSKPESLTSLQHRELYDLIDAAHGELGRRKLEYLRQHEAASEMSDESVAKIVNSGQVWFSYDNIADYAKVELAISIEEARLASLPDLVVRMWPLVNLTESVMDDEYRDLFLR